jgi:hypothetical protein
MQHHSVLHVFFVFIFEEIGSTDFTAATLLGANFGQMSFLFVFRKEPQLVLKEKSERKKEKNEKAKA